ncbi:ribosome-associated protein [Peptostreptococcus anaerobius]|uniref:Ribosomal silencing factor RsfS n=3 Tax=Peptostreptococcus anaerobius TaxID=1261 RepID=D3MUE5_9FIRM|nr:MULTISPECIES: ribosome silencing factor [Peptostreptococcus]EFD04272.1 iojap-like protein [Peptostreptococcus anaerobius 653-L]MCB6982901.1 ribosome silencing factor [Peptostreptococcus anaerobius]MCQ5150898.1 ribosome silencing factor [Peptostreptococcus anaerobius]MDB8820828.1 ribosome silencing factor [Peptostreptococcus anaerobius]MDB8825735.1 ribosome silencing factor [Peptostreptococcus anaerobius]
METVESILAKIYDAIDDKIGQDIVILNIGKVSSLCDYFVIATGSSSRQVKAIADSVEDEMTKIDIEPRGKEGITSQSWVLLDYGDIMVHIFDEENRGFYNLEKLWKDAPYVERDELA